MAVESILGNRVLPRIVSGVLAVLAGTAVALAPLPVPAHGVARAPQTRSALPPATVPSARLPSARSLLEGIPSTPRPADLEGRLTGLERRLFADAAGGRLDEFPLLAASLIASGVADEATLHRYLVRAEALADEVAARLPVDGPPLHRAETLFDFLHERVLAGGYRIDATDLRVTLDDGHFNCVSATVLFHGFAQRFHLSVQALQAPGHVMARLAIGEDAVDVETTYPGWFRTLNDPVRQAEAIAAAGGAAALVRREIGEVELLATIYYNRGVDLLAEGRFAEAVAANAKALRLDPANATAEGNLLASINNWAIALGAERRFAEAAALLRTGLALQPDYETFALNFVYVHHQWVEDLWESAAYSRAAEVLRTGAAVRPGEPYFDAALFENTRRQAEASGSQFDMPRKPS